MEDAAAGLGLRGRPARTVRRYTQVAEAPAIVRQFVHELVAAGRAIVVDQGTFSTLSEALGGAPEAGQWLSALVVELGAPIIVLIAATDGGDRTKVICITPPAWDSHDTAAYVEGLAGELATVAEPLSDTTARTN